MDKLPVDMDMNEVFKGCAVPPSMKNLAALLNSAPELPRKPKGPAFHDVDEFYQPEPENPKKAYGDKKIPIGLVPPVAIAHAAKAFQEGAIKYGSYNWRKTKVEAATYYHAALRHLHAWWDGEDVDPESGDLQVHHLGKVIACMAILLDAASADNRPEPGRFAALIRENERK